MRRFFVIEFDDINEPCYYSHDDLSPVVYESKAEAEAASMGDLLDRIIELVPAISEAGVATMTLERHAKLCGAERRANEAEKRIEELNLLLSSAIDHAGEMRGWVESLRAKRDKDQVEIAEWKAEAEKDRHLARLHAENFRQATDLLSSANRRLAAELAEANRKLTPSRS